jgi:hypothetical protein
VVSFTPRQLYPQGKSPWYPLDRRLGGPLSHSGRGGEEKNLRRGGGRLKAFCLFRYVTVPSVRKQQRFIDKAQQKMYIKLNGNAFLHKTVHLEGQECDG